MKSSVLVAIVGISTVFGGGAWAEAPRLTEGCFKGNVVGGRLDSPSEFPRSLKSFGKSLCLRSAAGSWIVETDVGIHYTLVSTKDDGYVGRGDGKVYIDDSSCGAGSAYPTLTILPRSKNKIDVITLSTYLCHGLAGAYQSRLFGSGTFTKK